MTIAQVSQKYGLTQDTLRYYERVGLLPRVNRSEGGKRDFLEKDLKWVDFIKCMRASGISVEALIEYVTLFQQGDSTAEARKAILISERDALADRVEKLSSTLKRLDNKIAAYDQRLALREAELRDTENEEDPL